jgi:hypothetical protein
VAAALDPRPAGTVFGRIVTGADVEDAALRTLKRLTPRYVEEAARQRGREPGKLPEPRGYIVASEFEKWPEDGLPVVVVISPGWSGPPQRMGDGTVLARWSLAAGVITSAASSRRTRENALIYVAALRTLIAQQQSLDGFALGVDCVDESYGVLPFSDTRTLYAAQAIFVVSVADAFAYGAGPGGPWGPPPDPPDPTDPPDWPRVKRADVQIVRRPLQADVSLTLARKE